MRVLWVILGSVVLLLAGCAAEQTTRLEWKRWAAPSGESYQYIGRTNIYQEIIITNAVAPPDSGRRGR